MSRTKGFPYMQLYKTEFLDFLGRPNWYTSPRICQSLQCPWSVWQCSCHLLEAGWCLRRALWRLKWNKDDLCWPIERYNSTHYVCWGWKPWSQWTEALGLPWLPQSRKCWNKTSVHLDKAVYIFISFTFLEYTNITFWVFENMSLQVGSWQASPPYVSTLTWYKLIPSHFEGCYI
jgi:hypothetical protein